MTDTTDDPIIVTEGGPFFFAWVNVTERVFGIEHCRSDEEILNLTIEHGEGDFPSAAIELRNPRVGLLGPGRKVWAWISWRGPDNVVHPLFFGRLIGIPENLQDKSVRINFISRPPDYEDQLEALAVTMRELPLYDPIWLSEEERADPNSVLEARTELWHVDRLTLDVSASDIITGDSVRVFMPGEIVDGSFKLSYSGQPARAALIEAGVQWNQSASSEIDITKHIYDAFKAGTPDDLQGIHGTSYSSSGQLVMMAGEEMLKSWPVPGARVGGGWQVGSISELNVIGPQPMGPTSMTLDQYDYLSTFGQPENSLRNPTPLNIGPGLYLEVIDYISYSPLGPFVGKTDVLWLPIWRMAGNMTMRFDASRARTEHVSMRLEANVQPILTDPGEDDVVRITLGNADVDGGDRAGTSDGQEVPIGDVSRPSYFKTDRGKLSVEHLIARARAQLAARARIVDIGVKVPFELGIDLSCRLEAQIINPALPGGAAQGKIKYYQLTVDGETGEFSAQVVIGCCVGRGGTIEPSAGSPSYVDDGYVDAGYQFMSGAGYLVTSLSDVGYDDFGDQPIDDDGVDLQNITADEYVMSVTVEGDLETQQEAADYNLGRSLAHPGSWSQDMINRINAVATKITVEMKPVTGGPFNTTFNVTTTQLVLPRTVDLEDSDNTDTT